MKTIQSVIGIGGALLLVASVFQLECSKESIDPIQVFDLATDVVAASAPDLTTSLTPMVTSISPASGPNTAATMLTVNGSGFAVGATVTVGGSPCQQVVLTSDTQLTCTAPARSVICGAQDVVVINPDNQRATAVGAFFYRSGTLAFSPLVSYAAGAQPDQLVVTDLDRDGKLDLANTNRGGSSITTRLGVGNGTFSSAATISTGVGGGGPSGLVAMDLTGDKKVDLLSANNIASNVTFLLGDGAGGYATPMATPVGTSPLGVAAGELNGDGKIDIVVANNVGNNVTVLLGDGAGGYAAKVNIASPGAPQVPALADLNGDGKLDIVFSNALLTGSFTYAAGVGDGTFNNRADIPVGNIPVGIAVADVNKDGKLDVVTGNNNTNNISVALGNGNGSFQTSKVYPASTQPRGVSITDVYGDSDSARWTDTHLPQARSAGNDNRRMGELC